MKQVTWNGIEYRSQSAAAKALGISKQAMDFRLEKGYTCDDELSTDRNAQEITWNGIEYKSLRAAARSLDISTEAMRYRLSKGYTCDEDLQKPMKPSAKSKLTGITRSIIRRNRKLHLCKCEECKRTFQSKSKYAVYCSDECKRKAQNRRYYQMHRDEIIQRVIDNRE